MRQTAFLLKSLVVVAMMGWAALSHAQGYEVERSRVYFGGEVLMEADARSLVDLGCGYAKDRYNVYMDGRVLENVDPSSFRLKARSSWRRPGHGSADEPVGPRRGYFKTQMNVYYGDKKIDAMPASFVDLGGGYAKDAFNVYYFGEKLKGCMASSFQLLEGGYAKDSFSAYYHGKKVEGAFASTFRYTGDGYAEDTFNAYYKGKQLK